MSVLTREPRALAFGLLHTIAATIGQTFVISLFLPGIKASFGLGDAQVALLFTLTTVASAAALWKVGPWIDRADVVRYSVSCGLLLVVAGAAMALAREAIVLVVGLFCLRLAGNGLLTHVALTATARYFTAGRGKALSLVMLGSSIGEALLPAPLVTLIATFGWRTTLALTGCLGLALVLAAAAAVRAQAAFRARQRVSADAGGSPPKSHAASADYAQRRFFTLTAPLFIAMPLVVTATIFHQALLAEAKGVSLQWFAVSFVAFAVSRVVCSLATGPVVDRAGSTGLFRVHLLPLAGGTAALVMLDSDWVVPFFWFCAGVSSGLGAVLHMTIVAERVPLERLGAARTIVGAVGILAAALGPTLYGAALALGADTPAILWGAVLLLAGATALGLFAANAPVRT
jgi:MFS family permease